jgi:N-methylhydantoinase B/oxoprolinase/acetone carboxylase alpha subunit
MGVAEQMGRVLQNVSVSANIKERLDFSCAIFYARWVTGLRTRLMSRP